MTKSAVPHEAKCIDRCVMRWHGDGIVRHHFTKSRSLGVLSGRKNAIKSITSGKNSDQMSLIVRLWAG